MTTVTSIAMQRRYNIFTFQTPTPWWSMGVVVIMFNSRSISTSFFMPNPSVRSQIMTGAVASPGLQTKRQYDILRVR